MSEEIIMPEKNKIILEADTSLRDEELRYFFSQLQTKVDTLNERTKKHTLEIRELKKLIGSQNKPEAKHLSTSTPKEKENNYTKDGAEEN